jgi:hypothetical protein
MRLARGVGGETFLVAGKGGPWGGTNLTGQGALLGRLGYHQTGVCLTPGFWSAWILVTRCAESEVAAGWVGEIHRERVQRLPFPLAITRHILSMMRRCPFNSAFDDREDGDDDEPLSLCRPVHVLVVTMRDSFVITFTSIRTSYFVLGPG